MTPAERRAASLLRQRMILSLVELAADLGTVGAERIHEHRDELTRLRASVANKRAVILRDERKAGKS